MTRAAPALFVLLAVTACGDRGGNASNGALPPPEETGDLNSAIGGDELSPIPEVEDDVAANLSNGANIAAPPPASRPGNGT
jgi:hypothetical protein